MSLSGTSLISLTALCVSRGDHVNLAATAGESEHFVFETCLSDNCPLSARDTAAVHERRKQPGATYVAVLTIAKQFRCVALGISSSLDMLETFNMRQFKWQFMRHFVSCIVDVPYALKFDPIMFNVRELVEKVEGAVHS